MLNNRIASAQECLQSYGLDFLVIFNLTTIRYLTGFTGSDGALVLGNRSAWFLTDSRYTTQASLETRGCAVREYRGKLEGVAALVREETGSRVGFEAAHTTVAIHGALAEALPGLELVPVKEELEALRLVKDHEEIELLAQCAAISSTAFLSILPLIRPGATERDLALELEIAMKRGGADEKAFDFIVASGPRGAMPHGRASDKAIQKGELVTFDFGAVHGGYNSDETVTVAVGQPDGRQQEVYAIVKAAHDLALSAVRPGISLKELDSIARNHIAAQGFGSYFGHGLGHGVGLDIHEKPTVSFRSGESAAEGMVFTIEPGIYIPDWGGVRIEDTVVVTADGCRLLTSVPKELIII